jgi:hypothetical protein
MDQKAAVVLCAFIAGLMSAAWLSTFSHLDRHPELLKPHLRETSCFPDTATGIGILLYFLGALLGWLVHPLPAVGIFVAVLVYYAWTGQGVDFGRSTDVSPNFIPLACAIGVDSKDRSVWSEIGWQHPVR